MKVKILKNNNMSFKKLGGQEQKYIKLKNNNMSDTVKKFEEMQDKKDFSLGDHVKIIHGNHKGAEALIVEEYENSCLVKLKSGTYIMVQYDCINKIPKKKIYSIPKHYKTYSIDVIDFCKMYDLNFNRGNIVKYVCRAGKKDDEIQDLKKALDYLQRELKHLENDRK